ncbi:MAG: orotate phosphoribosyltransferase [Chloroflexota bacterium]
MTFQTTFLDKTLMAELTAKMLLEVEAIRINVAEPFITTSGWATPVYTDCRKLISYPRLRNTLMDFAVSTIMRDIGFEHLDGIAGGETAGIPFAAWVADRLMLPMQYVRKKPKGFGRRAQIEGDLNDGDNILLVEDMATDGQSKFLFTDALREAGASVSHAFVIFYYDIFSHSQAMFDENNVTLHRLATWWDVLKVCKDDERFDTATISEIEAFLHAPNEWSAAHGGC